VDSKTDVFPEISFLWKTGRERLGSGGGIRKTRRGIGLTLGELYLSLSLLKEDISSDPEFLIVPFLYKDFIGAESIS